MRVAGSPLLISTSASGMANCEFVLGCPVLRGPEDPTFLTYERPQSTQRPLPIFCWRAPHPRTTSVAERP